MAGDPKQVSKEEFFDLYFRYSGAEAAGMSREEYHKNFFEAEEKPGMTFWAQDPPNSDHVTMRIVPGERELHLFLDAFPTDNVTAAPSAEPPRNDLHYCDGAGWLIGGSRELPSDPAEYDDRTHEIRGCNRLRCAKCGQMVRSVPGWRVRGGAAVNREAELYELADVAASPLLEKSEDWHFYLCRCDSHHVYSQESCDDRDNPWGFPQWSCAGHPAPKPRHISYGVEEPE